jgi:hypothetical protein
MTIAVTPFLLAVMACFFLADAMAASTQYRLRLPIEVTGEDGTTQSVTVKVDQGAGQQVRSLWMQIHGLEYSGMVSVRVNQSPWFLLNNDTVTVADPGKSYGGIGGGVATLKLTLSLPPSTVVDGPNTIHFRFNGTNGIASGFRVLAFNFVSADGRAVLASDTFLQEDPNTWEPPFSDPRNIADGRSLWHEAQLAASSLPNAPAIHAHCSDCHAQDGRDLKYFNFSNPSIIARSRFHGLSQLQGQQIASYIRSLPIANPGRPWNPPYQPGPGLDALPAASWAAGAGLTWVLDNDVDALPFIFSDKRSGKPPAISPAVFAPDGNLNPREIPIALPLPDWNHWLPRVHPIDAWGAHFENSALSRLYQTSDYAQLVRAGEIQTFFDKWSASRSRFLTPRLGQGSKKWSTRLTEAFYSAELWQLVKTWEIAQEFDLEERGARTWPNTIPASTAPAAVNIPDGPYGMGGSALTNEYFNSAWYELQLLVNSGNHRHRGRLPIDWVYFLGRFRDLQRLSERPEPSRLLITVIKAMQSSDPNIGPENISEGWRPDQNVDPRIMIAKEWAPLFSPLSNETKQAITGSLLTAWLNKNLQYPTVSYFQLGLSTVSGYARSTDLQDISGGRAWEAAPQFQAAGVSVQLIERLQEWGRNYTSLASLFRY